MRPSTMSGATALLEGYSSLLAEDRSVSQVGCCCGKTTLCVHRRIYLLVSGTGLDMVLCKYPNSDLAYRTEVLYRDLDLPHEPRLM